MPLPSLDFPLEGSKNIPSSTESSRKGIRRLRWNTRAGWELGNAALGAMPLFGKYSSQRGPILLGSLSKCLFLFVLSARNPKVSPALSLSLSLSFLRSGFYTVRSHAFDCNKPRIDSIYSHKLYDQIIHLTRLAKWQFHQCPDKHRQRKPIESWMNVREKDKKKFRWDEWNSNLYSSERL